jgi:uncharacterized protein YxeA
MKKISISIITLTLLVSANFFVWAYMNQPDKLQSWHGSHNSLIAHDGTYDIAMICAANAD